MLRTLIMRLYCCGRVVEGGLKVRTMVALASGSMVIIAGSIKKVQFAGVVVDK